MLVSDQSSARPAAISPAYRALAAGVAFSVAFTLLIWLLGDLLDAVPHAEDAGASWYYRKLIDPTLTSRLTAWGFYLLHQVSFWAVALMLVWVLLMENPRRGLVFGKKIASPSGSPRWRDATTATTSPGPPRLHVLVPPDGGHQRPPDRRAGCAAWCSLPTSRVSWRSTLRSAGSGWTEVARIPMIDYAAVFALAGLIGGALGLIRLMRGRLSPD